MSEHQCQEVFNNLVDYLDAELDGPEAQKAAIHLQECERCQNMAAALEKSLQLAKVIWQDGEKQASPPKKRLAQISMPALRIAACLVLAVGAGVVWRALSVPVNQGANELTIEQIELKAQRAAGAAQDLAVADMYTRQPRLERFARERYAYVIETFPDMEVAKQARSRLNALLKGVPDHE